MRPRIVVAAMGGTVATVPGPEGLNVIGRAAGDLLATLDGAREIAELVPVDVCHKHSRAITPRDMCTLAHEVTQALDDGCDGAVVTHGTDTLEETAYALALQIAPGRPVAVTGAMRPPSLGGADGTANVEAAIAIAASPEAGVVGPVVVLHDEIHLPRWVTKGHTVALNAFTSPGHGPLGAIVDGRPRIECRPVTGDFLGLPAAIDGRVELIWVTAGADGRLIDAAADADGIVIAGTGGGHVGPAMLDSIATTIDRGVPVVMSSRTGSGPLLTATYGGPGSETDLAQMGVISAGTLAPLKARLRLLVGLALEIDPKELFPL